MNTNSTQLWEGCILSAIAHAVFTAKAPDLSFTHSWDENNYSIKDGEGARGTISFERVGGGNFVGAFFDENCERSPFRKGGNRFTQELVDRLPTDFSQLAHDEAFQYLLEDVGGQVAITISTLFWGDPRKLEYADQLETFWENGGRLVRKELQSHSVAFDMWQKEYEFSNDELELVKSLFHRKILESNIEGLRLDENELQFLREISEGDEGLALCLECFGEIGISE